MTQALVCQLEVLKSRLRVKPFWEQKARRAKLGFATALQAAAQSPQGSGTVAEVVACHYAQYHAELHRFIQGPALAPGG